MTLAKIIKKIVDQAEILSKNKKNKCRLHRLHDFEIDIRVMQYILMDERISENSLIKSNCRIFEKMYAKSILRRGMEETLKNSILEEISHKITHSIKEGAVKGELPSFNKEKMPSEEIKDICSNAIKYAWVDFIFSNNKKLSPKDLLGYSSVNKLYRNREKLSVKKILERMSEIEKISPSAAAA